MSAVMVAPVDTVMTRGAVMADDARAMNRQNSAAASSTDKSGNGIGRLGIDGGFVVIIGIVIRIIVVIDAADKGAAEVTMMEEVVAGKARASRNACRCCDNRRSSADGAAANDRAAEMTGSETMSPAETAAAATTAASTTTSSSAMSAANFNRPFIGGGRSQVRHARMHRRQSFGALAGEGRSHQQCCDCAQHVERTSRKN